jgi:hypothetical protein
MSFLPAATAGASTGSSRPNASERALAPIGPGTPQSGSEQVAPHTASRVIGHSSPLETLNWSGIIDSGAFYTSVSGKWTVPAVTSPGGGDVYSGTWIGVDSPNHYNRLLTGTEQDVVGGKTSYSAFVRLYPDDTQTIVGTVDPGDVMQAQLLETSNNVWTVTIDDLTQSWQSSTPFDFETAGIATEWVEAAPDVSGVAQNLANFHSVTFSQIGVSASDLAASASTPVLMLAKNGVITAYPGPFAPGANHFTIFYGEPPPTVTSVSPAQGNSTGGTSVSVSGDGFGNATSVHFGTRAAKFVVNDDSNIVATAPPGPNGTVDITVTNPIGTSPTSASDHFTYAPPPPPPPANNGSLPGFVVGMAAMPDGSGYWLTDSQGAVSPHGNAADYGSMAGQPLNAPISHIVATADGNGYWLVASDGGTFAFGDAGFFGSMGGVRLNAPVVDIAPTRDDLGYWLVASDGGVFAFGDAAFLGSMGGRHLNQPVVGISPDNATSGYWLVASDGGIFSFGAPFYGSTGSMRLNKPVNSMASTPDSKGYWFVASDGGIFAFGDAAFHGSTGSLPLDAPVVGMASDNATGGYWLVALDGGVFSFGAPFYGED